MVIDRPTANRFIATYMTFLETLVSDDEKSGESTIQWLVIGRDRYVADRSQLDTYRSANPEADSEILDAIAAIRFGYWVYLKDTRSRSVMIAEDGSAAYGVLGLLDPLREVVRGTHSVIMETGLLPLKGHWVCDGLVKNPAWIGPNMRRDLADDYRILRQKGRFSLGPVETG